MSLHRILVLVAALFGALGASPASAQTSPRFSGLTVDLLPIFAACNGVMIGAGSSAISCPSTLPASRLPALTGDVTSSAGSAETTLATVNSNVGSFGSATQVPQITVDGKGRVTAAGNVTVTPALTSVTGLGAGVAAALAIPAGTANSVATVDAAGGLGHFRNRIINGNFDVWQRGTSFTLANGSLGSYTADRFYHYNTLGVSAAVTKINAPSGFRGAQAINVQATGASVGGYFDFAQRFEARNVADLDAKDCVVSFDLNATTSAGSLTGSVVVYANTAVDDGGFATLLASTSFTIPSGSGVVSVRLTAAQMAGLKNGALVSVRLTQAGSVGNPNVSLGAVQFEADRRIAGAWNNPTKFEFRPLPVELAMCKRYYNLIYLPPGAFVDQYAGGAQNIFFGVSYPEMRAAPTATLSGTSASNSSAATVSAMPAAALLGWTATGAGRIYVTNTGGAYITLSAEI